MSAKSGDPGMKSEPNHCRTRHERKMARNAAFARIDAQGEQCEREHPVLSGKVKVIDYIPPPGRYFPA